MSADPLNFLLTFKTSPMGLTTNIRNACLQIPIREHARDALRVLWIDKVPASGIDEPAILG